MASSMKSRKRKGSATGGGGPIKLKVLNHFMKPKTLLVLVLLFCWDVSNGTPSSHGHDHGHGHGHSPSMSMPMLSQSHHTSPPTHKNLNFFNFLRPQNQRLAQMLLAEPPQGRVGFQVAESPEDGLQAEEDGGDKNALIGGIGNGEMVNPDTFHDMKRRKKQDCGVPSVAVRSFMEPSILKRSYFANTKEDVEEKRQQEETARVKRETATKLHKRSTDINADGPLPWTCETKYEWEDKGADHYPRFVRTAECKSRFCFNGFFRCKPRRYKTKVLKRLTGTEVASCEEDDVSLPESLRSTWKFVTVTINLCCDCTTRVPGTDAV